RRGPPPARRTRAAAHRASHGQLALRRARAGRGKLTTILFSMTLTLATLLPGLLLLVLGALLLVQNSAIVAFFKALPRSQTATLIFFGSATLFFLYRVWHLSEADFGNYRTPLFIGFAIVAALAFKFVPDFLAVRGMAALMLLVAMPLLDAGYMNYEPPQIFLY